MTPAARAGLLALLKRHEGTGPTRGDRVFPYRDRGGKGKLTIGYGRNIKDNGITRLEAEYLLENDVFRSELEARRAFPWIATLAPARQVVIVELVFAMGIPRVQGFRKMLGALAAGDMAGASRELLDSDWAREVGTGTDRRAGMLAAMLRSGAWPEGIVGGLSDV